MSIIKRIIEFIKRVFSKKEIKLIEEPKQSATEIEVKDARTKFIESLKVTAINNIKKKKVETLMCAGDGLGIHSNIGY